MGVRILISKDGEEVMYDSVTMTAFGPIFDDDTFDYGLDEFIRWMDREYSVKNLYWFYQTEVLRFDSCYREWLSEARKGAA